MAQGDDDWRPGVQDYELVLEMKSAGPPLTTMTGVVMTDRDMRKAGPLEKRILSVTGSEQSVTVR